MTSGSPSVSSFVGFLCRIPWGRMGWVTTLTCLCDKSLVAKNTLSNTLSTVGVISGKEETFHRANVALEHGNNQIRTGIPDVGVIMTTKNFETTPKRGGFSPYCWGR
jgi:hypothetical protein